MKSKHNLSYPFVLFVVTMLVAIYLTNFSSSLYPMVLFVILCALILLKKLEFPKAKAHASL